uniref:PPIase cyclophilin-type domain-containing protein n=1 Tax=Calcidiscus leptoporus TaxID=127549 RepID=A0A7S0NWF3_9EUKA
MELAFAVKPTGNVFSYEAIKQLNLKTGNMHDLLDNTLFAKADLITIQDPSDGTRREIERFSHVKENLSAAVAAKTDGVRHNDATSRILSKLNKETALSKSAAGDAKPAGGGGSKAAASSSKGATSKLAPRWLQTTGKHSAGFTSTAVTPVTVNEIAALSDEEAARQRYAFLKAKKQKGYAQLQTTHGNLNLELHVDVVPMTCENFVQLCERGYYRGVGFHRLLRNFMVQGGDPTATGSGGESAWGKPFADEVSSKLKHHGRGVLSMANSGPNTNGSQFFITFKSAAHLDGKHSVFGRVVGGFDTLAKIEKVPTDETDKPTEPIAIVGVNILVNPFESVEDEMAEAHARASDPAAAQAADEAKQMAEDSQAWYNVPTARPQAHRSGIGKYIPQQPWEAAAAASPAAAAASVCESSAACESSTSAAVGEVALPPLKKAKHKGGAAFGDFSGW